MNDLLTIIIGIALLIPIVVGLWASMAWLVITIVGAIL